MAIISLNELITSVTRDEAVQTLIDVLDSVGFSASSWQSGSVQRTFLEMIADAWSQASITVSQISTNTYNDLATGTALTELSDSHFDNQRIAAIPTQGKVRLTAAAGIGPIAISIGDLVSISTATGNPTFRNITGGTLLLAGTLTLDWEGEVAGAAGNVANGTIDSLQTPIAGVTVDNPAISGTGTWITRNGVDVESDATLRVRNTTKWAVLSPNRPEDAYVNLALSSTDANGDSVGITRVFVDSSNPRGEGTIDTYLATSTGTASAQQVTDANTFMQPKRGIDADLLVLAATIASIGFAGTVTVSSGFKNQTTEDAITNAITGYLNGLPVGGADLGGSLGVVVRSEIVSVVMDVEGVLGFALTTPAADVTLLISDVAIPAVSPPFPFSGFVEV